MGPLKLQEAPLDSDLQAASASAGGAWGAPPAGCAEAALAIINEKIITKPPSASEAKNVIFLSVLRIEFIAVIS